MDSAKVVLCSIVLATQRVRNATVQYSTARRVRRIGQHSLIRLESEFQTITNAALAILRALEDPALCQHCMLDDRLVDWLSGIEPETCLDALNEMERLLSVERDAHLTPVRLACEEDDLNGAILLFHAHKAHFYYLLTTDIWNYRSVIDRRALSSHIESDVREKDDGRLVSHSIAIELEAQRKEIISQKIKKLLKLLDPLDCSDKHRETLSLRQSDTCIWLLTTEAYWSWRKGKSSFLWLQGKAGAGKSVLASFIVDDLSNTIDDGELLVYFYCDFRTKRSTSALEAMRSILAQLISQLTVAQLDSGELLDELLKDNHVERLYSIKELSRYLCKAARLCPRAPIIVVDALDECREVLSLLDGLTMSTGVLRIFATSRPLQSIISILSPFPCISMDKMADELSADILLHVTRELDGRLRLRTFDERLKEEIRLKLCAKADGMFRWVQCQIDTLEKCRSVSEIRRVLASLPEGLEETYRRILIAIDRQTTDARIVRRALVWLVTALRPMSMRELLEGITVDSTYKALDSRFRLMNGSDLLDVCRSLVVHHEETDIITLSHMSVKEYLVGDLVHAKLPRYHIVLEDAHERLARLCMAYITFCLWEMKVCRDRSSVLTREQDLETTTSHTSYPLLRYVLSDGFSHLSHLWSGNDRILKDIEALQAVTLRYAWEWNRMCKLVPSIRTGVPWPTSVHDFTFYILVAFASDVLLETHVGYAGFAPTDGTNPLVYAAHFGKTAHTRVLISQGADVNHPGLMINDLDIGDPYNMATPLEVAVARWDAEMIDLLLAQESVVIPDQLLAHVLAECPQEFPLYIINRLLQTTAFAKWAITPWENQRLLETLVDDAEDDVQADIKNDLALASKKLFEVGCAEILFLLAVEKGCIHAVELLLSMSTPSGLSSGAIVNALATNGDTPLHLATKLPMESQCLAITKLLVEAGCNTCDLDADDKPPIHSAVLRGFISVVEYLLSQDIPLPSRILFTALQVSLGKRVKMVRLLISKGANVHVLSPDGDSLLHVVTRSLDRSVCLQIIQILIDAGCDPSTCNLHGVTPLYISAKQRYFEVANYLLLFAPPSDIRSLLNPAPSTQEMTLRSLIGNSDGLRFGPEDEERTLQAIRQFLDDEERCLELVKCFVGAACNLFARSAGSAMLSDIAVIRRFTQIVEYLVSNAVPLPSRILFTALRHTEGLVPFLISKGADLHALEDSGDTLLHIAASFANEETVRSLVEAGCPTTTINAAGIQPIEAAVSRGSVVVVEYLISHSVQAGVPLPPGLIFAALSLERPYMMVRLLVNHGAQVPLCASNGEHLLHTVLRSSYIEYECLRIAETLVKAGCSPSASDAAGNTPLHIAITLGLSTVVSYLVLSQGVPLPPDILFYVLQFQPIFYWERRGDWLQILTVLIRGGADVHARDALMDTAMHRAVQLCETRICLSAVEILIEGGCSPCEPNFKGEIPVQIAKNRGLRAVVHRLNMNTVMYRASIVKRRVLDYFNLWVNS